MTYTEVTIYTTALGAEIVAALLGELDTGGVSIEDDADVAALADGGPRWDYIDESLLQRKREWVAVKTCIPDTENGPDMLAAIADGLERLRADSGLDIDLGPLTVEYGRADEADWAECWKQYFHPMRVGEHLIIKPSWETLENEPDMEGRAVMELDPGMAFGTGTHETTRLCLEALERVVKPGCTVWDVGCGSGILAIAALLFGAGRATGADVDDTALTVAADNGARNGLYPPRLVFKKSNLLDPGEIAAFTAEAGEPDVIAANIVADVIIPLTPILYPYLRPGGVFVASGVIETRADEVESALTAAGFTNVTKYEDNGWVAFVCR